ncbi:phosphopantetheine-binding protein [Micromonospora sp. NBC_01699]|uniref:phosphopantetheine-binding protein n=1 Tax=Micromonospora sp. NBC_01699 TaxID=2975984 RepID=UPI002E28BB06|nr:phosphopantetheine-binding protein [Micromonospora sp. NBC_01699]
MNSPSIEDIARLVPGVRDAARVTVDGPDAARLVLFVAAGGSTNPDRVTRAVLAALRTAPPTVPRPDAVLVRAELPRGADGLPDLAALGVLARGAQSPAAAAERAAAAEEEPAGQPDAAGPEPVPTPLQRIVLGAWAQVLGLAQVGLDDNFHEIGGDSTTAIEIAFRLRGQFQDIDLTEILVMDTPREAAEVLAALGTRQDRPA